MFSFIKKLSRSKNLFLIIVVVFLIGLGFSILFFKTNKLIRADELGINFGGWGYDNAFGWTSVSCNNIYGEDYKDYCGLDIEPILDINFDGNDVDFENNLVRDGYDNDPYFLGILSNFNKSDLRNGGKSKVTGAVERDSNFDNSLYFDGTSYIDFGTHEELDFDASDFTASLWFKVDEGLDKGLTENVYLFSNGSNVHRRYHCWIDKNYYLFCVVNNKQLKK